MKRQIVIIAAVSLLLGIFIGYFISLASSFKNSADAVPALASALSKTDDFSDTDMAVLIRMFRLSESGKPIHADQVAIWRLSAYYNQRSKMTPAEQRALGAAVLLPKIRALQNTNAQLRDAIDHEQNNKANKAEVATPTELAD